MGVSHFPLGHSEADDIGITLKYYGGGTKSNMQFN